MASGLFAGLGLDKDNFSNSFLLIGEQNVCDSSFLIASFIWQGLYKVDKDIPANICVLSLHNAREHYENLAIKLGFNIDNYVKKGNLRFLDGFKIVSNYFSDENLVKLNKSSNVLDCFLKDLFFLVKENLDSFLKERLNGGSVYVIIDDLSDLLSVGFSLKAVLSFVKYLRAFLSTIENFTLVIGTHFNESDREQCILYKNMYRVADYCTTVSGLKTGFSVDVSGSIKVVRKFLDIRNGLKVSKTDFYHFKLSDRQIKIFSPGSIL